jgi:hypothetical protein
MGLCRMVQFMMYSILLAAAIRRCGSIGRVGEVAGTRPRCAIWILERRGPVVDVEGGRAAREEARAGIQPPLSVTPGMLIR